MYRSLRAVFLLAVGLVFVPAALFAVAVIVHFFGFIGDPFVWARDAYEWATGTRWQDVVAYLVTGFFLLALFDDLVDRHDERLPGKYEGEGVFRD